ncbi:MAG TPA: MBL fold metallo-hydrolase RNA specificity domain-containing protein, partial [Candidatus Gracilibacteria bacterium]|nr:MBL fold metallo-hydrolase RNA specificity domain-containing protein [Candidatus Gracilibacteria bacterium]
MESTYGGRLHDSIENSSEKMKEIINKTVQRGGKIIIPSFALERTQEILYVLEDLLTKNEIPNLPIYVDSPMAINITEIFQRERSIYDTEMKARYANYTPFQNINIKYTESVEESKRINYRQGPCIIISASGMCEAGRIRHHLANNIIDRRNTILFVGYMAENTLGRTLINHPDEVSILGRRYPVHAEIIKINCFSGHADENDLLSWLNNLKAVESVVLVHGERECQNKLASKISYPVQIAKFAETLSF